MSHLTRTVTLLGTLVAMIALPMQSAMAVILPPRPYAGDSYAVPTVAHHAASSGTGTWTMVLIGIAVAAAVVLVALAGRAVARQFHTHQPSAA